ncbi:unnamed protein product [Clavelina lepadiformis]|uniref:Uncharacterized protein n=1 Tax=Clavelina lepadiformis TaxID=159417 RepID=A0ABP0GZ91_CLALP
MQTDHLTADFPELESDGRLLRQIRDPPGQQIRYIPPGDPARVTYRLSTFKLFPREVQVDVRKLASAGFCFTCFKDRTKCFSCGQSVQEWEVEDDPKLLRWHRSNCDFINGTRTRNIPMDSILRQFGFTPLHGHRNAASSATRPPTSENPQASEDQRKVITNDIGNTSNSPNTTAVTMLQTATFRNSSCSTPPPSVDSSTMVNSHRNLATTLMTMNLFPCSNPANPHMMSEKTCLQTFFDHSSSWPAHRIRATPRQIANAGMCYLGVRDRVKCWYCNGGLQNWERDDDPWEEHAKWFPFLRNGHRNGGPEIIDPREEVRYLERKVDGEMSSSELVEQAKLMGFDKRMIKTALKRKYETTGNGFSRLEILVESILAMEEESASNRSKEEASATKKATPSTTSSNLSTASGLQEIRRLQEERTCEVCGNEQASVVLIPCGHIACCIGCAENASNLTLF